MTEGTPPPDPVRLLEAQASLTNARASLICAWAKVLHPLWSPLLLVLAWAVAAYLGIELPGIVLDVLRLPAAAGGSP